MLNLVNERQNTEVGVKSEIHVSALAASFESHFDDVTRVCVWRCFLSGF